MRLPRRVLLVIMSAAAAARPALTQEASGTLLRADISAPASGAIIEAQRLLDGRTIARTVSSTRGTWHLRLTADPLVLRVLRIGFPPHVLDTLRLAVGEHRQLNATLPGIAVVLPARRTASDARCRVHPDSASLVATVFHNARTALTASLLTSPDGPVAARIRTTNELWEHDESQVLESTYRETRSDSPQPFPTLPVDSLFESGFITREQERFAGMRRAMDVAVNYRVPSVDYFVDDRFVADYCLHLAQARPDRPDWIGVGFRPARTRRITQIDGTLWIDRHTAELRRLEFGYAGLEGRELQIGPGGWLDFTRLDTGLWFVNRRALRMPALGAWVQTLGGLPVSVITRYLQIVRVSGEVLELVVDSRAVFTAGATDFVRSGALVPIPSSSDAPRPSCAGAPDQALVSGTVVSTAGAVLPAADLRFVWHADGGPSAGWLETTARTGQGGRYDACGVPRDRLVTVEVRADGHEPAAIALRVDSPRTEARLDLVLVPSARPSKIPE